MFWIILAILASCLTAIIFIVLKKDRKRLEERNNLPRFKTVEIPVLNPQHIDEFIKKYDEQFIENDDYRFKQARMKEEHYGEKVYRYAPAYLPVKIEGHDVYSMLGDWVKVGEIEEDINGKPSLLLFINEYKDVRNIGFEKVKGDPFYVLKVKVDL